MGDFPLSMRCVGKEVNGITVHKTVPSGGRRSAGRFHRPPNEDQFLREIDVLALLYNYTMDFVDLPVYHSWFPKPGEIINF